MTEVVYRRERREITLEVKGHAGYAREGGADIVCSAVSMLCCAALRWAREEEGRGRLVVAALRQEAGDVLLRVAAREGEEARVRGALDVVACGLAMLAEGYPGFVGVRVEEA